jgi:DNA-binding CsgD family transcriptional regulator
MLARSAPRGRLSAGEQRQLCAQAPLLSSVTSAARRHLRQRALLDSLGAGGAVTQALVVFDDLGEPAWLSDGLRRALEPLGEARRARLWDEIQGRFAVLEERRTTRAEVPLPLGGWALRLQRHRDGASPPTWVGALVRTEDVEALLAARYRLTPTESAVLGCLGEGMSNADIGARLEIATATAATHVKAILAKLDVPSRLHAGLLSQRAHLTDAIDDARPPAGLSRPAGSRSRSGRS